MILHTFNKTDALSSFAPFIQADDQVLLVEDGVYALLDNDFKLATSKVFALDEDLATRGISSKIGSSINRVSYKDFVQMCCNADSISNWF